MADSSAACRVESFTAGDGYRFAYRLYEPRTQPKADVIAIHGIQSHGGWYGDSCSRMADAGYRVSFLDRRGSGLNQDRRGDAPGFRRLLDDIAEVIRARTSGDPPNRLVFLVAISWGGKLAVGLQRRHPGLCQGLAFVCPGFFPKVRPSKKERLGIALARLVSPRKLFPIPLNDPELFTANPPWQKFIREDPLSLRFATARLLVESVRLDGYARMAMNAVTAPSLLLLAENDRIIDNDRTRAFFEKLPTIHKTVKVYPGAHHTLEFEPNPRPIIDDLIAWIDRVAADAK